MRTKIRLFFETTNHFHKYLLVHIRFTFTATGIKGCKTIEKRLPNKMWTTPNSESIYQSLF